MDPNGDRLEHTLYYRPVGDSQWHLLAKELKVPFYPLKRGRFADGRYHFKVESSDHLDNPKDETLSDFSISRIIDIDNTPPQIESPRVKVGGRSATITFTARDSASELVYGRYGVAGRKVEPLLADDRMLDSRKESFTIRLDDLSPGTHMVTIFVVDKSGNVGYREAKLRIR